MNVVIACDSYKGSCSAEEAAESIALGIKMVYKNAVIEKIPIADGGEGMTAAILASLKGRYKQVAVKNPLGNDREAGFAILEDGTAVIEMAAASGITVISREKLNPFVTTTYGTGQLILAALDEGCSRIIIGIGGSATNDGGAGMAQALGVSFKDKDGNELGFGGGELSRLAVIDISKADARLAKTQIIIASDVTNPLCGEKGASAVYGPQKGATPEMVKVLDENLRHFAEIAKQQLNRDITDEEGAGAAGGLGAGLMLFCNGRMKSGIATVLDLVNFDEKIRQADLVITGEGRIDRQSAYGKVPVGVAQRVKQHKNIPVIAIVGSIGQGAEAVYDYGIDGIISIAPGPISLDEAMKNVHPLLTDAAQRLLRIMKSSSEILGKAEL